MSEDRIKLGWYILSFDIFYV